MKKSIAIILVLVIALSLFACSTESDTNETTQLNPSGTYTSISFADTNALYVDFLSQASGSSPEKETIVIAATDSGYSYRDSIYSGSITDIDDCNFMVKKEQVITTDPFMQQTAEQVIKQNPYSSYIVYENYLINNTPINCSINGELPTETRNAACAINIEHITFSTYSLTFSTDGTFQIMTFFNKDISTCNGTYTVNGKIISLTLTKGNFYGQELTGNIEMSLYAEDNKLYDMVYIKN